MKSFIQSFRALCMGLLWTVAAQASGLHVEQARSYPTPSPGVTAVGFLDIVNDGSGADRLLRAESPLAKRVEIHEMTMANGVMRMRALSSLPVPVGEPTRLAPGGTHLMLFSPTRALQVGDAVPVTLWFEKAGRVDATLKVEARPEP